MNIRCGFSFVYMALLLLKKLAILLLPNCNGVRDRFELSIVNAFERLAYIFIQLIFFARLVGRA